MSQKQNIDTKQQNQSKLEGQWAQLLERNQEDKQLPLFALVMWLLKIDNKQENQVEINNCTGVVQQYMDSHEGGFDQDKKFCYQQALAILNWHRNNQSDPDLNQGEKQVGKKSSGKANDPGEVEGAQRDQQYQTKQKGQEQQQGRSGQQDQSQSTKKSNASHKQQQPVGNTNKQNQEQPSHNNNHQQQQQGQKKPVDNANKQNQEQPNRNNNNQQQQQYIYPHNDQQQHQSNINIEEDDLNQFGVQSPTFNKMQQESNKKENISKNYKQYLRLVFDHYCKISYATGNDPTFQQIQKKSNIMTINKFMMFCKQFGVVNLGFLSRNYLVELFKKNAQFYRQMNFDQFMGLLLKISHRVYSQDNQGEPVEDSKQFQQLLLFLEVNNLDVFRKKSQKLNIAYRPTNIPQNKQAILNKYKFKYSNNDEEAEVYSHRQRPDVHKIKEDRNRLEKSNSVKNQIKMRKEHNTNNNRILKSVRSHTSSTREQLAPPRPPVKQQSVSVHRMPQKTPQPEIVGYANIYKMKKQRQNGSKLKLNSIVEDARKMMMSNQRDERNYKLNEYLFQNKLRTQGRQTPISDYQSINSSRIGDPLHSQRKSIISEDHTHNQYLQLQQSNKSQLKQLLGQQDDDQYLKKHLNNQPTNRHITKRIQARIKEMNLQ